MKIKLSDHFNYGRLLRFTFPSIAMMLFTSAYSIVDGFFVSNYAGKVSFTAVNFAFPMIYILACVGTMTGAGGSALIGKYLGQKKKQLANRIFSMLVYLTLVLGGLLGLVGFIFARSSLVALGGQGEMLRIAVRYSRICLLGMPFLMLQIEFQSFFVLAEKPKLGFVVTVLTGVTNMLLDALLVGLFKWGVSGAALASVSSQLLFSFLALGYFYNPNSSLLRLGRTSIYPRAIWQTFLNGSSEMMSTLAMSFVSMLYNMQLLKYAGEDGVAAFGVLMYLGFVFVACFVGYSIGIAPVVSYHFGAENHDELQNLLKKGFILIGITSCLMFVIGETMAHPLAHLFTGYDEHLLAMTKHAFVIYSFAFLFTGIPIFGSSFFTALNDGITSAMISFLRTLVLQLAAVLILPLMFGLNGIWLSLIVAELSASCITLLFLYLKKDRYHYFQKKAA